MRSGNGAKKKNSKKMKNKSKKRKRVIRKKSEKMMRLLQILITIIIFAILAAACGDIPATPRIYSATENSVPQPLTVESAMPAPSDPLLTHQCRSIRQVDTAPVDLDGILALEDFGSGTARPEIKLIDLGKNITLPMNMPAASGKRSPDGRWLMFGGYTIESPVFVGQDGKVLKTQYWEDDWVAVRWISNESLLVSQSKEDADGRVNFDNTLIRLNPFTGQWDKLPRDFPDIFLGYSPAPMDLPYYWTNYNSTFTLASYISKDAATVLVDVSTQKIVWKHEQNLPYIGEWSPSGDQLALPVRVNHVPELFLVQHDGTSTQLTNIQAMKDDNGEVAHLALMGWSPAGNYILFVFETIDNIFGIVNTHTKELNLFCLPVDYTIMDYEWSPDENKIALGFEYAGVWYTGIMDFSDATIYNFADNSTVAGWISETP